MKSLTFDFLLRQDLHAIGWELPASSCVPSQFAKDENPGKVQNVQ
jgi:hypothetical protein